MIDPELMEQFQFLAQMIKSSEERMTSQIAASEQRTRLFVENSVSKKIESLFDSYKLTHEKQWELERKTDALTQKLETLEERLAILESKTT